MNEKGDVEERLAALERQVTELRREFNKNDRNWPDRFFGGMKEIPKEDFEAFVRAGKEFRDAQTDPEGL